MDSVELCKSAHSLFIDDRTTTSHHIKSKRKQFEHRTRIGHRIVGSTNTDLILTQHFGSFSLNCRIMFLFQATHNAPAKTHTHTQAHTRSFACHRTHVLVKNIFKTYFATILFFVPRTVHRFNPTESDGESFVSKQSLVSLSS